ncbi:hypothetical protein ABK040_009901 [Willaertia magna]
MSSSNDVQFTYHGVSKKLFEEDKAKYEDKYFFGDQKDGFLHTSLASECEKSVKLYQSSVNDLILLKINVRKLEKEREVDEKVGEIKFDWVESRKNYFPHIFGLLPTNCIDEIISVPKVDNSHSFENIKLEN